MRAVCYCLLVLLPLLSACQSTPRAPDAATGQLRLQGEVFRQDGQLVLRPCQEPHRFLLQDAGGANLAQEVDQQLARGSGPLFADLRGTLAAGTRGADDTLAVTSLYRLQRLAHGCEDADFRRLTVHAMGAAPRWSLDAGTQGMVLRRADQAPLALPYTEEGLPDGSIALSSEANGQRIELWVTPQRCIDPGSGALTHLSAELRVDGSVLRGCAYYGGARSG